MQKDGISPISIDKLCLTIAQEIYNSHVNYVELEKELGDLKEGGPLTYEHLNLLCDEKLWPTFSDWYQWPAKELIIDKLSETDDLFMDLKDYQSKECTRQLEIDSAIFNKLFKIFKNTELISIILRFIDPVNFAIYSPPVAFYIKSPRGVNYQDEYANYLVEIRKYREIFQLEKAAFVDMFIWSLSKAQERQLNNTVARNLRPYRNVIKNKADYEAINKTLPATLLSKTDDLDISEFFNDLGLYDLAARSAGVAFETAIGHKYKEKILKRNTFTNDRLPDLNTAIGPLCKELGKDEFPLREVQRLRNKASHPTTHLFTKKEVDFMVEITKEIKKW